MSKEKKEEKKTLFGMEIDSLSSCKPIPPPKKLDPKDAFKLQLEIQEQINANNGAHLRGVKKLFEEGKV